MTKATWEVGGGGGGGASTWGRWSGGRGGDYHNRSQEIHSEMQSGTIPLLTLEKTLYQ